MATVDLSALDALPDSKMGTPKKELSGEQKAALLRYWPVKRQMDVARILGLSEDTCRQRYREITRQS